MAIPNARQVSASLPRVASCVRGPVSGSSRASTSRARTSRLFASLILLAGLALATDSKALEGLPDFTDLVQRNHEAVVNISTRSGSVDTADEATDDPEVDESVEDLIRRYRGQSPRERGFDTRAQGSGFIISSDGYVLTNNHVVEGAGEVLVRLHDRRQYVAEVVGTDPRSDMAVLKIDGEKLPVVTIGGINSQIYSRTGSFMGLSFAIPIEMAMDVAAQIQESGTVRRGWLGVIIQEVTMDLAESFGMWCAKARRSRCWSTSASCRGPIRSGPRRRPQHLAMQISSRSASCRLMTRRASALAWIEAVSW